MVSISAGIVLWREVVNVDTKKALKVRELDVLKEDAQRFAEDYEHEHRAFHALAEGVEAAVFICELDTTVRFANRAARTLFDFENPDGRTFLSLTLCYDLHNFMLEVINQPEHSQREINLLYPSEIILFSSIWPQFDAEGKISQLFVSLNDITQLKKLEEIRRDFVANVSHELRTPLGSIRAMADTIIDDPDLDPKLLNRWLNSIVHETERLTRIADDLLILSRTESQPPRMEPVELNEVFEDVASKLLSKAEESGLELTTNLQKDLWVSGNYDQLQQVALNLIENAIKYTQVGKIIVLAENRGDKVVVAVTDTGIGILAEDQPRIFERFYRVDKARSKATGGTGLGLSIVKHIIDSLNGTIIVESEFRKGTTFTIQLPKLSAKEIASLKELDQ